jgi:hypothetical protein
MPFYEETERRWQIIFIGWKDIGNACGGVCAETIEEIANKYDMPFTRINGRPSITDDELRLWWERLRFRQGKGPKVVRRFNRERNES